MEQEEIPARFPVRHFRQILIWPFRLTSLAGRCTRPSDWQARLVRAMTGEGSPWSVDHDPFGRTLGISSQSAYAAFVFFHPFVQRFLYGEPTSRLMRGKPAFQCLTRDDVRAVRVALKMWLPEPNAERPEEGSAPDATAKSSESKQSDPSRLVLDVERLQMFIFGTQVAVLVLEVVSRAALPLPTVELLQDQLRRAYPPYWEGDEKMSARAGHCPRTVRWLGADGRPIGRESDYDNRDYFTQFFREHKTPPLAAHWRWLLEPLAPCVLRVSPSALGYDHIIDDRIPGMSYLAFDDPTKLSRGDFIRLGLFDDDGARDTLPYATGFLADFEKTYCYDRFWDPGKPGHEWMNTRYLCCGYGFTMIGPWRSESDSRDHFFSDGEGGALAHFRSHYFIMGLIAHFQYATLLTISDRISQAVHNVLGRSSRRFRRDIMQVHQDLTHFTNRYWFREISNQVQGRELFTLWTERLGLGSLYEQVLQETVNSDNMLETRWQDRLQWVAIVGLVLSLVFSFLAVDIFVDGWQDSKYLWWYVIGTFMAALILMFAMGGLLWEGFETCCRRIKNTFCRNVLMDDWTESE